MALPFAYRAPAPPMFASGQSQQNQLYQALSTPPPRPNYTHVSDVREGVEQGSTNDPNQTVYTPWQNASPTASVDPTTHQPPATPTDNNNGGGGGGGGGYDFSGDPILAQIRAMNAQNIANAEAAALAKRKQAEVGYGYDANLQYEDPATAEAARQNPFSTIAQMLLNHNQRTNNLTEAENKANLFYSGERINQTGLEGRQYTLENANAGGQLQNLMGQIAQGVLDAKQQAQQSELSGEQAAYDRALQFALANNTGYPGSGGGGGGGGGYDPKDFQYGATIPSGHTEDQIHQAAVNGAPHGAVPMHIMNQGMVQNGQVSIKYRMPDGTTNTIWVPIG